MGGSYGLEGSWYYYVAQACNVGNDCALLQRVTLGNRILPVFSTILLPLRSQTWPSKCRKAAVVSPGCQCCTRNCMHYNALTWLCYVCVLWAKIPLQRYRCCCFGFKYVVPVWFFVFRLVWKSVFLCLLWHLCGHKTMQTCPAACFQHSYLSLLSVLAFWRDCRGGIFVTLCAGFELVCSRGYHERIVISACCSKICVHLIWLEQQKPPILALPPPLSVDVAVLPVPSRGRDTNLSHVLSISSPCVAPTTRAQHLTDSRCLSMRAERLHCHY